MKKILVVNVNWVGDVIFSTPVFKALKSSYPAASISCLAVPRVRDILESAPCLDEIIIYDEKGRHQTPWAKIKLILELRKKKFDVAFLLHRSLTRALLIFLAGIPVRVGYDTKKRGFLLTHRAEPLSDTAHRSDYYLGVIESFGIQVKDRSCELKVYDDARLFVEKLLNENGVTKNDFAVVINAGGNWDLKRWPKENFAKLADRLVEDFKAKVIISGAPKDVLLAGEIVSMARHKPVVLTGRTNLKQLAALLEKVNLVISNDSGPLHVANCVGTSVVGLFGPTRPEITGPRGKGRFRIIQNDVQCNQKPCYDLGCSDNVCMKSITVEQVVDEIRRFKN
ncbi:MAG TPA: lipopolysaccharide heptosyltransferase II [Candidatus Omnitrophota bacterium]|nr:lipopolysaccharide heptosyltransferase II [Candidatus Omnitrophota bacterium]HPD84979.1 lipopolysaccharide heptosyltransferase II [Candidatus Omnitrophota bacterium]HRZ03837.1 lipopolysaccharide heptosyltransferase II [Candidatus Omnitrophota bacterium]